MVAGGLGAAPGRRDRRRWPRSFCARPASRRRSASPPTARSSAPTGAAWRACSASGPTPARSGRVILRPALSRPAAAVAVPARPDVLAPRRTPEDDRARRGLDQRAPGQAVLVGRGVQPHARRRCRAPIRSPDSTSCGFATPTSSRSCAWWRPGRSRSRGRDVARALTAHDAASRRAADPAAMSRSSSSPSRRAVVARAIGRPARAARSRSAAGA